MKFLIALAIVILLLILFAIAMSPVEGSESEIDWDRLVAAVIQVESGGDHNAVSSAGAVGLMQITPIVVKEFHMIVCKPQCNDIIALYDPQTNKSIGLWYLKRLKDHYLKEDFTLERLCAAYNGGITKLRHLLRQSKDWQDMPRESRAYVGKVLKIYQQ